MKDLEGETDRANQYSIVFLIILSVGGLLGCSLDVSIYSPKTTGADILRKAESSEVIPASSQNQYSTRGFKVQASLNYRNTRTDEVITARGFRVYTNVQRTLYKE